MFFKDIGEFWRNMVSSIRKQKQIPGFAWNSKNVNLESEILVEISNSTQKQAIKSHLHRYVTSLKQRIVLPKKPIKTMHKYL